MRLRIFLFVLLFGLVGCSSNVSPETVDTATDTLFATVGVKLDRRETMQHVNIEQIEYTGESEELYYKVQYYQLSDDATKSGFQDLIADEYDFLPSIAICKSSRSSIVIYKGDSDRNRLSLEDEDKDAIIAFGDELGCRVTYIERTTL